MSEYQYVGFRAIERPVSDDHLEYMEQQSSRAEVTPWSFDNEYHYGDFRGNTLEVMELHDHFGQKTTIRLSNLQRNPKTSPDLYTFTVPKGADVVTE